MLSFLEQCEVFDGIRSKIDTELRSTGFEDLLGERGFPVSAGQLIVARSFEYATQNATIDTDLDPLALRLGVNYEVGTLIETPSQRSYRGLLIGFAFEGESAEPFSVGKDLDYVQVLSVFTAIGTLRDAKATRLPYITKSLKKVDPFGD